MARVYKQSEGKRLGLPGRTSVEILSGEKGARGMTFRMVEIPVPAPGDPQRGPHHHNDTEECIYVLSGRATTYADSGKYPLEAGDTLLMPAGEKHVTRNTGSQSLVLLCFFPVADVAKATEEPPTPKAGPGR
jgi:quercetin dioxygenase-like cupin family protein